MPVTVGVNFLSVVHASSNGTTIAFPDVCKTPSPAGPIPIPYPNIAKSSDTAKGTTKVKCDGNPTCVKDSNFSMSTGDEAGSAGGGVVSNKIKGKAEFVTVLDGREIRGQERVPRVRHHAAQRQEHAAVSGVAGAGRRRRCIESDLSRLQQEDLIRPTRDG